MKVDRLLVAAGVTAVALSLHAQVHTVSSVGIVVKPQVYNGPCPATINFIATIHVTRHPVKVTYEWIRSDGAHAGRETIEIDSAGRGVRDAWTLGRGREHLRVWEQLHVLAPTGVSSPREVATINCR